MGRVTVSNLGKAYKQYPNRWSRLVEWLVPFNKVRHHLHWVLQGLNFEVNPGEAVGIIGINGAGKSTLLKMITGTTQPTSGSVNITGRVAALLELGMGFHPEFTGRQNAIMAGQLLGYSVKDIAMLMPQIEAFAEIGEYIDQPVRMYSSGMQMRLAFSVATAKRPDILIIDEALAVGDARFQHKCVDRIREFSNEGTTLLFVSHDPGAVKNLCDRAILINAGKLEYMGEPDDVLDYYNALLARGENAIEVSKKITEIKRGVNDGSAGKVKSKSTLGIRSGNSKISINSIKLLSGKVPVQLVTSGSEVCIELKVKIIEAVGEFCVGFSIRDRYGNVIVGSNTELLKCNPNASRDINDILMQFNLPTLNIGPGSYSISIALHDPQSHVVSNYDWWDKAVMFEVVQSSNAAVAGLCYMPVEFKLLESKLKIKNLEVN